MSTLVPALALVDIVMAFLACPLFSGTARADDYMNLLFLGFAGDTTRGKVQDLAGSLWPLGSSGPGLGSGSQPPVTPS